jgi:phosphoribosylamine--glycine ligase
VLTICGTAPDIRQARQCAYAGVDTLTWPEGFCRRDIAARAL